MYLGHVIVTSCAIQADTATELFIIQPEAGARSPQKALKATSRDQELKDALRKLR